MLTLRRWNKQQLVMCLLGLLGLLGLLHFSTFISQGTCKLRCLLLLFLDTLQKQVFVTTTTRSRCDKPE